MEHGTLIPLVAEATADTVSWLNSLQFVGTIAVLALVLWGNITGRAQRREVSFTGTPVDKAEFEKHIGQNREEHDSLFSKLGGVERGLRAELKTDTNALAEKIGGVDRKVSGLECATEAQDKMILGIAQKLDRLIERFSK